MLIDKGRSGLCKAQVMTLNSSSKSTTLEQIINIAIIDDHPLYRDGVAQTLNRTNRFELVAQGESRQDAIRIGHDHRPHVMMLDINIPGGGIEAACEIAQTFPEIKIVFLTVSDADADVFAGLDAGGCGYILKGVSGPDLAETVIAVHRGEIVITPSLAGRMLTTLNKKLNTGMPGVSHSELTAREDVIHEHVSRGLSNKEVANTLNLTEKTVKHYMTTIMQKLQVRNRVEAAMVRRTPGAAKIASRLKTDK
jgi:two-component system, NarL family, nitrate/nitrite response regulator NarL